LGQCAIANVVFDGVPRQAWSGSLNYRLIPADSVIVRNRFASTFEIVSTEPRKGHRISILSTLFAEPRPKWSRRSFCDMKLDPDRTSWTIRLPPAVTVTRAPMPSRFDLTPISRRDRNPPRGKVSFRSRLGVSFSFVMN